MKWAPFLENLCTAIHCLAENTNNATRVVVLVRPASQQIQRARIYYIYIFLKNKWKTNLKNKLSFSNTDLLAICSAPHVSITVEAPCRCLSRKLSTLHWSLRLPDKKSRKPARTQTVTLAHTGRGRGALELQAETEANPRELRGEAMAAPPLPGRYLDPSSIVVVNPCRSDMAERPALCVLLCVAQWAVPWLRGILLRRRRCAPARAADGLGDGELAAAGAWGGAGAGGRGRIRDTQ